MSTHVQASVVPTLTSRFSKDLLDSLVVSDLSTRYVTRFNSTNISEAVQAC